MTTTQQLIQALFSRGWKQSAISRRTGIPQPRLSKWAAGRVPAGAEDALKLKALVDAQAQPEVGDAGPMQGVDVHEPSLPVSTPEGNASQTSEETI